MKVMEAVKRTVREDALLDLIDSEDPVEVIENWFKLTLPLELLPPYERRRWAFIRGWFRLDSRERLSSTVKRFFRYLKYRMWISEKKAKAIIAYVNRQLAEDEKAIALGYDPNDVRDAVTRVIEMIEASRKYVNLRDIPAYLVRYLLENYVPYFKVKQCRSAMLAIKVSALTLEHIIGRNVKIYIARYVPVKAIKPSTWAVRGIPIDFRFHDLINEKPDWDIISIRMFAGRHRLDYETELPLARDTLGRPFIAFRTRDVIYVPMWVVRAFCHAIGKPEDWIDVDHCSVYAVISRHTPTGDRYARAEKMSDDLERLRYVRKHRIGKWLRMLFGEY